MPPDQVFIVGMNGSGTTMLLDCLAGHSSLYGFRGETKVLPYFIERQAKYGNLANDDNFAALWGDLQSSVSGRDWPRLVDRSVINAWIGRPRSVAAVFDWIMSSLASKEGKRIWCEKTPMYVHHISLLAAAFPRAKFIHVIRDGRDCAASFNRRWQFNPIRTAYRWRQAVQAGRSQGAQLESRYFEVRYERLTESPEDVFREICEFLELPYEPAILKLSRQRPQMTGSMEGSVMRNERRAEQFFPPDVLREIEAVAGMCLAECGYSVRYQSGDKTPAKWKLRWWEFTDDRRRLRETIKTAANMSESGRWAYFSRRLLSALKQKRTLGP
jgi:hypothetical protein